MNRPTLRNRPYQRRAAGVLPPRLGTVTAAAVLVLIAGGSLAGCKSTSNASSASHTRSQAAQTAQPSPSANDGAAASEAAASGAAASEAAASEAASEAASAAASSAAASAAASSAAAVQKSAAAAAQSAAASKSAAAPTQAAPPAPDCTPGYDPCIAPGSDVDCQGGSGNGPRYVTGPIRVTGDDPYDLDRDGDGIGCES